MLFGHLQRVGHDWATELKWTEVRIWDLQGSSVVKNLSAIAGDSGDAGLIPGLGRSPGGGNGNLLQYSCQENPVDRGAWQATVHGVAKSWTWLSNIAYTHTHTHTHTHKSEYRGLFFKTAFCELAAAAAAAKSLQSCPTLFFGWMFSCLYTLYKLVYLLPFYYTCTALYANILLLYSQILSGKHFS